MRQVREGALTPADARAARDVLDTVLQAAIEMQPSEALRGTAERLLGVHPLRAADALQLAAAIQWCQGMTAGQGVVVFDRRLRDAGYAEGFTVLPDNL
jgi:predicted nucleic acid-binding protein